MRHLIRIIPTIFALLLLNACASTPERDPFTVSREDVLAKVETIALAPVSFQSVPTASNDFAQQVDSLIVAELEQAGFKVIPSSTYKSINEPIADNAGGIFDPRTGKADTQKSNQILYVTHKELTDREGADAFLYPTVTLAKAKWFEGGARWDGVKASTTGKDCFWCSFGAAQKSGTTSASSLRVMLVDANNNMQYSQLGGIELLSHYDFGFKEVPASELYKNKDRNQLAVQIALGPLVGKEQPKLGLIEDVFF